MEKEINKEWIITVLLWFFLWYFWVHRFYNWKIWTGLLMLFTFGWFWIWWLVDWIIILVWNFRHKDGTLIGFYKANNPEIVNTQTNNYVTNNYISNTPENKSTEL